MTSSFFSKTEFNGYVTFYGGQTTEEAAAAGFSSAVDFLTMAAPLSIYP